MGFGDQVGAVRARRCETCSRRRSTTNTLTLSLLLAALLSYLWYGRLMSGTSGVFEEPIAATLDNLAHARASQAPPPAAAIPAPAVQPPRAAAVTSHPSPPQPPARRHREANRPSRELDGLY